MTPVTLRCPLAVVTVISGEHGHFVRPTFSRREGSTLWGCGARWDWEWMGTAKPVANFSHRVGQFEAFAAMVELGLHDHCLPHDLVDPLSGLAHEFVECVFDVSQSPVVIDFPRKSWVSNFR